MNMVVYLDALTDRVRWLRMDAGSFQEERILAMIARVSLSKEGGRFDVSIAGELVESFELKQVEMADEQDY